MPSYQYSFEKLDVWQESRIFVKMIYDYTKKFPDNEKFILTSQIQRAAISVASNIAEGTGRVSKKEKERFYQIAYGSLMETYCQLIISMDLGYIDEQSFDEIKPQIFSITYKLNALIRSLENPK